MWRLVHVSAYAMRPTDVYETLRTWIERQRWYPKGESFDIVEAWRIGENLYVGVLKTKDALVFLPLRISRNLPQGLPAHLVAKIDGRFAYEAEFCLSYVSMLLGGDVPGLRTQIIRKLGRVFRIRPLLLGSTNRLVAIEAEGGLAVLKSYRTLDPLNPEAKFIEYLSGDLAPQLHAKCMWKEFSVSIVTEYVNIDREVGEYFYISAVTSLREGKVVLPLKGAVLASSFIASLHKRMAKCGACWCRGGIVREEDIRKWRERLNVYSERVRENAIRLLGKDAVELIDSRVDRAAGLFEEFRGKVKLRTHQDLHLGQIVQAKDRLLALDFEGEPARKDRGTLEPPIRDVACAMRSLTYIAFHAALEALKLSPAEFAQLILKGKASFAKLWVLRTSKLLLELYLAETLDQALYIHGLRDSLYAWGEKAVEAWLVERGLYEAWYESHYRPAETLVPLLGLAALGP